MPATLSTVETGAVARGHQPPPPQEQDERWRYEPLAGHDLMLGLYSVHTNADALHQGKVSVTAIGRRLRTAG